MFKQLNKKWYPQSVLVGSRVTTDQIAKRLAAESTVSPADVKAVLEALSVVMGDYMAQGRSVKLDGIGSFFFQSSATGNGKDKAEDVSASDINGVKVRFIPETTCKRGGGSAKKGRRATCALTDVDIEWIDVATLGVNVTASDNDSNSNQSSKLGVCRFPVWRGCSNVTMRNDSLVTIDVHNVIRGQVLYVNEREGGEAHECKNVTNEGEIVVLELHVEQNVECTSHVPYSFLILAAKLLFLLASIAMQNVAVCGIRTGYDLAT